nr:immunoglobulin heavy chain junction region [Mus musculus]
ITVQEGSFITTVEGTTLT